MSQGFNVYFIAAGIGDHQTLELWNLQHVSGGLNQLTVRKRGAFARKPFAEK